MPKEKEPKLPEWSYNTTTKEYRYFNGETGIEIDATEFGYLDAEYSDWKQRNPATNLNVPAIKPSPDSGWEFLNGGRGQEITQFCGNKFRPGDPRNRRFFRSQRELLETCRREGYSVERTR